MIEQATALLGLLAETPIHAGAGQTVGVIDLPIQREAHTAWPCIYGSAVKGAMRTLAEHKEKKDNEKWVTAVFGPPPEGTSDHAGALAVGDARLLLLPVRSLTSHFKWVTCPALLKRFIADCQRLNIMTLSSKSNKESKDDGEVLVSQQDAKIQETLFLEEFRFKVEQTDLSEIIQALTQLMARDDAETVLHEQLAIVSNDMFKHLAEHATPVNAHTAIDNDTKTVKPGALWYEETLPPDTLLYIALVASCSRKPVQDKKNGKSAEKVLKHIENLFADYSYLQVGGNETVGMGWCHLKILRGSNHATDHATRTS